MPGRCIGSLGQMWIVFVTLPFWIGLSAQSIPRISMPDSPAVAQWKDRLSSIQKTLQERDENCYGAPAPSVIDAFGVSGDALSVALVDFCTGGAYTDYIVAMRETREGPVIARFRDAKGKSVENGFASGASAMHTVDVKLVEAKKAIYDVFAENDSEGKPARCGAKAYVWNAKSETFDLDLRLSKSASDEYCRSVHEK
jgi:hypothetical protein